MFKAHQKTPQLMNCEVFDILMTLRFGQTDLFEKSVFDHTVKAWIESIEVFLVELIGNNSERFTEALIVSDFSLAQEFDNITNIGIVNQAQNVVIGYTRFLLCSVHLRVTKNLWNT